MRCLFRGENIQFPGWIPGLTGDFNVPSPGSQECENHLWQWQGHWSGPGRQDWCCQFWGGLVCWGKFLGRSSGVCMHWSVRSYLLTVGHLSPSMNVIPREQDVPAIE